MERGLTIAAALILGGTVAAQPPRAGQAVPPQLVIPTAEDAVEQLEAQLDVKRAVMKEAEVEVAAAKAKYNRLAQQRGTGTVTAGVVEEAKFDLDAAAARLDTRKAEMNEVAVRLKQAQRRVGGAKPAPGPGRDGKAPPRPAAGEDRTGVVPASKTTRIEVRAPASGVRLAEELVKEAVGRAVAPAGSGPRSLVAVFNMAAVMKDYDKAKYQVYLLGKMRETKSADLSKLRAKYLELQKKNTDVVDPDRKDKVSKELLEVSRKYEDEEKRVNKVLNDEASRIVARLYDEVKAVVDKTAADNGYQVVLAYPDAVTEEEKANPYLKELKLKPPAAQPFFVNPQVDITKKVIRTLNTTYPPLDENGEKVDTNNLPAANPPAPPAYPPGAVPLPVTPERPKR